MQMPRIDDELAKNAYDQGLSDREIGLRVDAHPKSVAKWRRRNGLPSNVPQGRPRKDGRMRKSENRTNRY